MSCALGLLGELPYISDRRACHAVTSQEVCIVEETRIAAAETEVAGRALAHGFAGRGSG
jgi:hypothetical protein